MKYLFIGLSKIFYFILGIPVVIIFIIIDFFSKGKSAENKNFLSWKFKDD